MFYRINWHPSTRRVLLESNASAAPAVIGGEGMTNLGTFEHDNEAEESTSLNGMQGLADNHVLFHHVQVATVNEKGVVHGVAVGNAVITAMLRSDDTISATGNVTVA